MLLCDPIEFGTQKILISLIFFHLHLAVPLTKQTTKNGAGVMKITILLMTTMTTTGVMTIGAMIWVLAVARKMILR